METTNTNETKLNQRRTKARGPRETKWDEEQGTQCVQYNWRWSHVLQTEDSFVWKSNTAAAGQPGLQTCRRWRWRGIRARRTQLILTHTSAHLVHLLLVNQLGGVHKVLAVKQDDRGCNCTCSTPEHHVSQGLCPCITWKQTASSSSSSSCLGCYSVNKAASNELLSLHNFDRPRVRWILTLKCFAEQIQSKE